MLSRDGSDCQARRVSRTLLRQGLGRYFRVFHVQTLGNNRTRRRIAHSPSLASHAQPSRFETYFPKHITRYYIVIDRIFNRSRLNRCTQTSPHPAVLALVMNPKVLMSVNSHRHSRVPEAIVRFRLHLRVALLATRGCDASSRGSLNFSDTSG